MEKLECLSVKGFKGEFALHGMQEVTDTLHSLKPATMAGFVVLRPTGTLTLFGPEMPFFWAGRVFLGRKWAGKKSSFYIT